MGIYAKAYNNLDYLNTDMEYLDGYYDVTSHTANKVSVRLDATDDYYNDIILRYDFFGYAFNYSESSGLLSGTITSVNITINGKKLLVAEGLSLDVKELRDMEDYDYDSLTDIISREQFSGNDTIYCGFYDDDISGYAGKDKIYGEGGEDSIYGGSGNDKLYGGKGIDIIYGGTGNDTVVGGANYDELWGGDGKDIFVFQSASQSPNILLSDVIHDFSKSDKIDVHLVDANSQKSGNQNFKFISTEAFTGHAGELAVHYHDYYRYIEADRNGDKIADMVIEINASRHLTSSNFIL